MKYAANPARLVYVAGLGERPSAPRVVVREADGAAITLGAGLDPCWLDAQTVLYRDHATGEVMRAPWPLWAVSGLGVFANELSAGGRRHASALTPVGQPPIIVVSTGAVLSQAFEPSFSPDGRWLAYRRHTTGDLELADFTRSPIRLGPGTRARWHSSTLVWEWGGRVFGRATPDQPTVELTIPGRACAFPVPCWDGTRLWVALVVDDGELVLAEWGSLVARAPMGYVVGRSGGSAFSWDVAVAA